MLHRGRKYVAQAFKYVAQGLQICCTGPAIIMHRACKYVAQGVQIYCTGPANMLRGACRYDDEPINILHRAYNILRLLGRTRFVVKMFNRVPPNVVRSGLLQLGKLRFCMVYSGQTCFDFVSFGCVSVESRICDFGNSLESDAVSDTFNNL